ncbi:LLM class flavin-dependent oxidoreductase [Actinomadura kijaniata]|uniref:LLM class flavin-dependent oxidoreductase n=1 Tax=Actinomadura kijaniata TaxID=46161 RepID=UPI003F1A7350
MIATSDIGVFLPTREAMVGEGWTPRRLIDFAVRAERLGYASAWVTDSLASTRVEPLSMLAAAAGATSRLRLGTGALIPAYRNPLNAAHTLASLDLLSQGRLTVTVGGGFPRSADREFAMAGVPMKGRFAWLDEVVALWRTLWSQPRAGSFHGQVLSYDDLPELPLPHTPGGPPVWLAGASPSALRRTARLYDGWLPYPPDPAEFADGLAMIGKHAGEREVTPALMATVLVEPSPERARERLDAYCEAFYGRPLAFLETFQLYATGTEEQVAERLRAFVDAGARHILLRLAVLDADDQFDQLERLAFLTEGA